VGSSGLLRPLALSLVSGLVGALVALVAVVATGAFRETPTTTTVERVVERRSATAPAASSAVGVPVRSAPGAAFDARRIYRQHAPGVVTISAEVGGEAVTGSGFVASADGLIVTNAHVVTTSPDAQTAADVEAGRRIYARFANGNSLPARIVGWDLFDDVAVLRVQPRERLHALRFGDPAGLEVGAPLAVIGSPFGRDQEQSLSVGVVSALDRSILPPAVDFETPGVIQTDAAINHGNSGGPVFDARGRVVGVAAQIESTGGGGEGVGFAIPADAVQRSLRDLVTRGKVDYAWLGVATQPISPELARQFALPVTRGLLVDRVEPGGPAARAGLSAGRRTAEFQDEPDPIHPDGDILVAIDGEALRTADDLARAVAANRPGDRASLDVIRGQRRLRVPVTLGQRPPNVRR
jgi:S1-C subfamily serine protease